MNQIHLNELPDRLSLYRDGLNKELQDRVEAILASHGFSSCKRISIRWTWR